MSPDARPRVILLPGAVLPAALAYADLVPELGSDVEADPLELRLYRDERPPAAYSLDDEAEGVLDRAERAGVDRFHLVGYSAGGAVSLVLAARYPERLLSLSLLEPAWAGNEGVSPEEEAARSQFGAIVRLPAPEMMDAFVRAQLRDGVTPPAPPSGPAPPWMAKRPAGVAALVRAFGAHHLDMDALRGFGGPVYYALGGLSNPDLYGERADRLAGIFGDFTVEVYEDRHHFDPPHRAEPARLARSLRRVWGTGAPA